MMTKKTKVYIKTEKGKWLAHNNSYVGLLNGTGIKFVLEKYRAYNFLDKKTAEFWICVLACDGIKASIIEEKM